MQIPTRKAAMSHVGFGPAERCLLSWILRTWSWNACCKCYALLFGRGLQVTIDGIEKCCIRGALFNEVEPQSLPGAVSDRIKWLFSTNDTDSVHFSKRIAQLNQALTFTSVSATPDSRLTRSETILTYSMEGMNRHFSVPLRGTTDIFSLSPKVLTNTLISI